MFPSLPTVGNMTKHRQETMFPQQCFLVCPGLNISLYSGKFVMIKDKNLYSKMNPYSSTNLVRMLSQSKSMKGLTNYLVDKIKFESHMI